MDTMPGQTVITVVRRSFTHFTGLLKYLNLSPRIALVNLFISSSVEEALASLNPGQKSLGGGGVKGTTKFWPIVLRSRRKLGKSFFKKSAKNIPI
jgi:hypothetical protein